MSEDLIGKTIDHYRIIEPLGEGGMAAVFKALDTRLNRVVAVKIIRPGKEKKESFLRRFELEAKLLAALTHPNIVRVVNYGSYDDLPYLVMEHIPGGDLRRHRGQKLPYTQAARLLAPVARALAYAHSHNIIHRDVKPANILLTDQDEPMLADFGIAKMLETEEVTALTKTGFGIGTPEYMAPEQAISGKVDHRADIYALGVVFYELITGRTPFAADTPLNVLMKQHNEALPLPTDDVPDLPKEVVQVIYKALAKKPANRFDSMEAFAEVLDQLAHNKLKEIKLKASRPGIQARKPFPIAAAAVIGLLFLAGTALILTGLFNPFAGGSTAAPTPQDGGSVSAALPTFTAQPSSAPSELSETPTPVHTATHTRQPTNTGTTTPIPTPTLLMQTPVNGLAVSAQVISLQNLEQLTELNTWDLGEIIDIAYSDNGRFLASSSTQGIFLLDLENKKQQLIEGVSAQSKIAFSQDGRLLAFAADNSRTTILDTGSGLLWEPFFTGSYSGLVFDLESEILIAGSSDGQLRRWQITDPDQQTVENLSAYTGHTGSISVLAILDNLIASGSDDLTVRLWDEADGSSLHEMRTHTQSITTLVFSDDGARLASGSSDTRAALWDVTTGQLQHTLNHNSAVNDLLFTLDGESLVVGLKNGNIIFWKISETRQVKLLEQYGSAITALALSPDGKMIAVGTADGVMALWGISSP